MPKRPKFNPKYSAQIGLWILNIPAHLSQTGKRARRYFPERREALQAARQLREQKEKFGGSLSELSGTRLLESVEAFKLLDAHKDRTGVDSSLLSIVLGYLAKFEQEKASVSLWELFDQYVASRSHLSKIHLRSLRAMQKRFKEVRPLVCSIEPKHLTDALQGLSDTTRNRYLKTLNSIFAFGIKRDYCKTNPASKIELAHRQKRPIEGVGCFAKELRDIRSSF